MGSARSPAFQFYPSDWLGSRAVRLMDAEQRGWYIQLLAEAWQSRPQATLPNDGELLIRLADANQQSENFRSRWAFVLSQFKLKGELLVNARLANEKRKQNDYHQQRKDAGAKGAEKRWRERSEKKEDTAKVSHSSAIAEPSESYGSANSKPIAENSSSSSSSSSSSPTTSEKNEKKGRADKPRDPRQDHPAIQAVREAKGSFPVKDTWDLVIKVIGDQPDVARMKACWLAWRGKGHSPMNLDWLVDWYMNGIPGDRNGTNKSRFESGSERNARNLKENVDYIRRLSSASSPTDSEGPTGVLPSGT